MIEVLSYGLWNRVRKIANRARRRSCAIAYVSSADIISFKRGDSLVVDASDESIKGARTNAKLLEKLYKNGIELWSCTNLHAKILLLDDTSIVSSANLSSHSRNQLFETAIITDRPDVAGQIEKILAYLKGVSTRIDDDFIKRIIKLPITERPRFGPTNGFKPGKNHQRPETWLISLYEMKYPGNEEEVEKVAKLVKKSVNMRQNEVDWFFWPAGYSFSKKAKVGDSVIEIFRDYPQSRTSRGVTVSRHGRIRRIFKERGENNITYHCAWPKDVEETSLGWAEFVRLAKRAGITRKLSPRSNIAMTESQSNVLYELWPKGSS
jgi:hypothetical protein